ncbi:histidine kinase dimerization/phospho-acceptor domain-containing protein [Pedobacter sp. L105]|uniref:sensor histidine kinase n=1 Tax=Pedobacter sp. L105 TaxID=1641871 RepID=UPI00131B1BC4|nr:histidine kinase dimerization/phospho-acceptor domain-containing protein [Pedobacter sp. L105]
MIPSENQLQTIPDNEENRLKKIYQYEIIDTPSETDFDTIALLAAEIFATKYAGICFIDKEHVFFKTNLNTMESPQLSRENTLYEQVVLKKEPLVIYEPLAQHNIKFFAAAPIVTADAFILGAVYVTDPNPQPQVSGSQLRMLHLLSELVMDKLESRLQDKKLVQAHHERFHRLSHDIKNPVTSISLYAQLLGSREMSREKVFSMAEKIEKSCRGIEKNLHELTH